MTCGNVYQFGLMLDFEGNNRGFAFVPFYHKKSAEYAIQLFKNYEMVKGKRLSVVHSVNNDRLYIGNQISIKKKLIQKFFFLIENIC